MLIFVRPNTTKTGTQTLKNHRQVTKLEKKEKKKRKKKKRENI